MLTFKFVLYNCAYAWLFGKPHYFMNASPLKPLYTPLFDSFMVHITTTPTIRDSMIISATPPSVLTKTIAITELDIGAGGGTELIVKYI